VWGWWQQASKVCAWVCAGGALVALAAPQPQWVLLRGHVVNNLRGQSSAWLSRRMRGPPLAAGTQVVCIKPGGGPDQATHRMHASAPPARVCGCVGQPVLADGSSS
jgi:hypothetical protein